MNRQRSAFSIIYLTVFIDILGFSILLPMLPYFAQQLGATGVWIGVLMTSYSLAQFVSAPILGKISDRVGRRPVVLLSLLGSAIAFALSALSTQLAFLIFARVFAGLCGGSISAAQAFIADATKPEERSKYMGILGAVIGVAFIVGPGCGAFLSKIGFSASAWFSSALAFINFIWAYFKLPESLSLQTRESNMQKRELFSWGSIFAHPLFKYSLPAMFLMMFSFVCMEITFSLLAQKKFGVGAFQLGLIFTLVGFMGALVQGGGISRIVKKWGELKTSAIGLAILSVTLFALPYAASLTQTVCALGLMGVGHALAHPCLTAHLSKESSAKSQGTVLGVGQSIMSGARALSPVVSGALFDANEHYPYLLAGLFAALAFALILVCQRKREQLSQMG